MTDLGASRSRRLYVTARPRFRAASRNAGTAYRARTPAESPENGSTRPSGVAGARPESKSKEVVL